MTALLAEPEPEAVIPAAAVPQVKAMLTRTLVSLSMAVVAPAVLFWTTMVAFNVDAAVSVALAGVTGAMCWRLATGRSVPRLLVLTLGIMTIRTAFTLVTGNTFVYFVQPVFADAGVAALFLASLWSAQPIVARLAPDFYPMEPGLAARPRVKRLFWRLTLLWGLVVLAKGTTTLVLLLSQSTANFVLIKSTAIIALTLLAAGATVAMSVAVGRQEGLLGPAGSGRSPA